MHKQKLYSSLKYLDCECYENGSTSVNCDEAGRCDCKTNIGGVKCDNYHVHQIWWVSPRLIRLHWYTAQHWHWRGTCVQRAEIWRCCWQLSLLQHIREIWWSLSWTTVRILWTLQFKRHNQENGESMERYITVLRKTPHGLTTRGTFWWSAREDDGKA